MRRTTNRRRYKGNSINKFIKAKNRNKHDFVYDAIIKTLVYLGNVINKKEIRSINKLTCEIHVDKFQIEKPLIGMVNNIEVTTKHKTVVDLDEFNRKIEKIDVDWERRC